MATDEHKKEEVAADERRQSGLNPKSFFEYIKLAADREPNEQIDGWVARVSEAAMFPRVMEYAKWRNQEDSFFEKSHPLLFMIPHIWLPGREGRYEYLVRVDGKGQNFTLRERSTISRRIGMSIVSDWDISRLPRFLNDFLVPCIIRDLDNQILNGSRASYGVDGLLKQAGIEAKGKSLKDVCLNAMEEFCQKAGKLPSVIVMSASKKIQFIKALSKENPSVLFQSFEQENFCFAGVPIVLSKFMPNDSIALANFDDICLISKKGASELERWKHNDGSNKIQFVYTCHCNIVLKEESSFMKVDLSPRS